jgi:hypothetical protein
MEDKNPYCCYAWSIMLGIPRYRHTVYLVAYIMEGCYRSPHRTIDRLVEAYADFVPTDGKPWSNEEPALEFPQVETVPKLNFSQMS